MQLKKISTGVLVAMLGVGAAAVAPVPAAAAPADGWGPVVDVSASAPQIYEPQVAIGPRGRAVAAWVRADDDGSAVFMASRGTTGAWGDPARVPGSYGAGEVALGIAGDGEVVLGWTSGRAVKSARKAVGRAWSQPVVLHRTATGVRGAVPAYLRMVVNGHGRAAATWQTLDDDRDAVQIRPRAQAAVGTATGAWSAARTLSDPAKRAAEPEATIDRLGRVIVVWNESTYGDNSRVMVTAREPGAAWASVEALSRRSSGAGVPQIDQNAAGDVAVGWSFQSGTSSGIRMRSWRWGSDWSGTSAVPDVGAQVWWVDLGVDGAGTTTIGWTNRPGAAWSAERTRDGRWSSQRVAPAGSVYYGLTLRVNDAGDALMGWVSMAEDSLSVQAAYRDRTNGWGPSTTLSGASGDAYGPALALDLSGDAAAVWSFARNLRGPFRVQARAFTG